MRESFLHLTQTRRRTYRASAQRRQLVMGPAGSGREPRGRAVTPLRSARTPKFLRYIAANVRDLRGRATLTQEKLAEAVSIDVTYLQRIERAEANLSIDILVALADAFKVDPERLFQETTLPPPRLGRPPKKRSAPTPEGFGPASG